MNKMIYQNRSKTLVYLILNILTIAGLTVYLVGFNDEPVTSITSLLFVGFTIYTAYSSIGLINKVLKVTPVIIISDFAIEISRNFKNECFSWVEIEDWRILNHADSTEIALSIGGKQKFIEISDLNTTPLEIRRILETKLPGKEFIEG